MHGVIDPEVLWACTTCGACVEQCPVDIEHVDHIVDMRRYQVMIESEFPTELGGLFRNLENKGNPWGQNAERPAGVDEGPRLRGAGVRRRARSGPRVPVLGGLRRRVRGRRKKTTRAVAELLHRAGVGFAVLGTDETCTGDPARRAGNEFLFQMLAPQTVETVQRRVRGPRAGHAEDRRDLPALLQHAGQRVRELGGHYEVMHHTQLLNRLVRDRRAGAGRRADRTEDVTYHDPCYLGRHNKVYSPPRELIGASGVTLAEMPRNGDRSICCGAGGARMWMEEQIGKRINLERVDEALDTGAEKIATGCPFCRVMLTDGLTARQNEGRGEHVEVVDVSQLLLAAVKRGDPAPDEKVDQLGDGAPGVDTTPLSGTQVNGAGPASAVTADAEGDVSVGGSSPGGASTKGANPDASPPAGEHPGGG